MLALALLLTTGLAPDGGSVKWPAGRLDLAGYVRTADSAVSPEVGAIGKLVSLGRLAEARPRAERLVLKDRSIEAHRTLIDVARAQGNLAGLLDRWERTRPATRSAVGLAWAVGKAIHAGDMRRSDADADHVLSILRSRKADRNVAVLTSVGWALWWTAEFSEGRATLERAIALAPENDRLRMSVASSYLSSSTGDPKVDRAKNLRNRFREDLAVRHARIAAKRGSRYAPLYQLLGGAEEKAGRDAEALRHYRTFLRYTQASPESRKTIEAQVRELERRLAKKSVKG